MKIGKLHVSKEKADLNIFELGIFGNYGRNLSGIRCGIFGVKLFYWEFVFYWLIEK